MASKKIRLPYFFILFFFCLQFVSNSTLAQEPCPRLLSEFEEVELLSQVSRLQETFSQGFLSEREMQEKLQIQISQLIRQTPEELREAKKNEISSVINLHRELALTQFKQRLLLKHLKGLKWDSRDRRFLKNLGIPISVYRKLTVEQAKLVRPFYVYLTENQGAVWDPELGWDLSVLGEVNANKIWEDPWFTASLFLFTSPGVVLGIANLERTVAIPIDQTVFLPPIKVGPVTGMVQVKKLNQYRAEVKNHLEKFGTEIEYFLKASQDVNETLSSFSGMINFKWFSADEVETQEGERDRAYERMLWHFNVLSRDYGIPKELKEILLVQMIQTNDVEKLHIQNTLNQIDAKETAFYAASSVVLAIYLAPVIAPIIKAVVGRAGLGAVGKILMGGGAAGLPQLSLAARAIGAAPWALPGQTAAVTFGYVLPLTFGFLSAGLHAAVDSAHGYGSFWCQFSKHSSQSVPGSLAGGSWLAFIPVGGLAVQSFAASMTGIEELGVAAKNTYQLLASTILTALMVRNGAQNHQRSHQTKDQAKAFAEQPGNGEVVNALSARALKESADAGIDYGFAAAGATGALRSGWKGAAAGVEKYRELRKTSPSESPTDLPAVRMEIQVPTESRGAPVLADANPGSVPAQILSMEVRSEVELAKAVEGLNVEIRKNGGQPAEAVIVTGEEARPILAEAEHTAQAVKNAGLAKRVVRFLGAPPETRAQALKEYWKTNHHRVVLTLVRLGLVTGSSVLSIVVTFHAPLLNALEASIGLGLISASLNYWGNDFYKFAISGDHMTKAFAKRNGIEIKFDAKGRYTDPKLERFANHERRFYYFLTEVVFVGTGVALRTAAGVQAPEAHFLETLGSSLLTSVMAVYSQGEWDSQGTRFLNRSTREISQELLQNGQAGKYSQADISKLAQEILDAKWDCLPKLESLDPVLGAKFKQAMNQFQVRLFLGSVISVGSMVASLSPMPSMGYLGFGLLTAMGFSLRYSLEMNELLVKWRETGVNPVLREVVQAMEQRVNELPMIIPDPVTAQGDQD